MTAAATRKGDMSMGHCFSPRGNTSGAGSVFINGVAAHVAGNTSSWPSHTCGTSSHPSKTASGSGTVFVEGKPLARIGDPLDCGDMIAQGSSNVFAGG